MKTKSLIREEDYVVNPTEPLYGDRIPKFRFPDGDERFTDGRSGMNYGAFLVEKLANKRANPIINSLVSYFYGEDEELRNAALERLRTIAEEYKID